MVADELEGPRVGSGVVREVEAEDRDECQRHDPERAAPGQLAECQERKWNDQDAEAWPDQVVHLRGQRNAERRGRVDVRDRGGDAERVGGSCQELDLRGARAAQLVTEHRVDDDRRQQVDRREGRDTHCDADRDDRQFRRGVAPEATEVPDAAHHRRGEGQRILATRRPDHREQHRVDRDRDEIADEMRGRSGVEWRHGQAARTGSRQSSPRRGGGQPILYQSSSGGHERQQGRGKRAMGSRASIWVRLIGPVRPLAGCREPVVEKPGIAANTRVIVSV